MASSTIGGLPELGKIDSVSWHTRPSVRQSASLADPPSRSLPPTKTSTLMGVVARTPDVAAGFSRMAPGTHIKPHQGWVTTVYRAHLGLVVPPDCALRVGEETRQWREGETVVFDDTVTHEAWNYGNRDRIVLLFDFVRPGCEDMPQDELPASVADFVRRGG
ncbi:aspartyl/asparaginyl beta-hydroxylase domain-containing protein [Micromonospora sp. NPDC047134]|uniref:aspartyl/asparaginyl beta-hydroxylase domain-containing protein n=1 Tax=Micromonospora sp. NPDC047134 TaxID=3154340 RepID=UPI0033F645F6